MEELTQIIWDCCEGNKYSEQRLYSYTYDRFKNIASQVRKKAQTYKRDHSIYDDVLSGTTMLVHEAYIKLASEKQLNVESSKEFFLLVSKIMRHILIDHYRKLTADKRSGVVDNLESDALFKNELNLNLMTIEQGIVQLADIYPRQAETFQLRYFIGLQNKEIANIQGVSESLIDKDLKFSKTWISNMATAA